MALLDFFNMFKKYKKLAITIIALVVILLPVVIVVDRLVDIVSNLKSYHYIGADVAYKNTLNVRGEGKVYTKPDIAFVNLSVVTEGKNIKNVQNENSEKMNGVIAFLKDFGIEEKDIKTTGYRLYPQYSYENRRIPQIIGYEITQTLEVKIRNLEKIGEILDNAVGIGINQVNSLQFGVDNDKELREQAKELAIKDAKDKAKKLASQLGIKLIKLSGFSEDSDYGFPVYRAAEEFGIGGGAPDIEVGENEIMVNVTLIYEID